MCEALDDEVTSINSIYGDETLVEVSSETKTYALKLPSRPSVSVRVEFALDYPDSPPAITGTHHVGAATAKGEGTRLVEILCSVLAEVYQPGEPCIFDLIEESNTKLEQLGEGTGSGDSGQQVTETNGQAGSHASSLNANVDSEVQASSDDSLTEPPPWILSDPISEKKSLFLARAAPVHTVSEAKAYLAHLLSTDKKVAKATHNITAWRIRDPSNPSVQYQDCDDDGESAAGGRVLHLLELMGVWDVMVVVSRWYGGVQLGPDRFRFINMCARDAVVTGGFVVEGEAKGEKGKDAGKKKGKK